MPKVLDELTNIFQKESDYIDVNGKLLKAKMQESALKFDQTFLKILMKSEILRNAFFSEVDSFFVFDKVKFSWMINSKEFLPDSYTRYKAKIGLIDYNENFIINKDIVNLAFPHKDSYLEFDSTEINEKRQEVFYNILLNKEEIDVLKEKKVFTNFKTFEYENKSDSVQLDKLDNLVIKGNNLIVMESLKEKYQGKIKLIYWDILYNTDNDEVPYNDSIKHSSWLLMMKNRLEVAKILLADDGLIFVQCDKNEDSYLTVLMDEIFCENDSKRSNHITNISVKSNSISGVKTAHKEKTILKNKDTILVYKKKSEITLNPQYSVKNEWDTHYNSILRKKDSTYEIVSLKTECINNNIINKNETLRANSLDNPKFKKFVLDNADKIFQPVNSIKKDKKQESLSKPDVLISWIDNDEEYFAINGRRLSFLSNTISEIDGKREFVQLLGDLWTDIDFQNTQNEGLVSLPAGKKPEFLIKRIIDLTTKPGDIVLDAFFGSGTTGAVAMKMNRKFIGIEQLDEHFEKAVQRLKNVIAGDQSGISKLVNWQGGSYFSQFELKKLNLSLIDEIEVVQEKNVNNLYNKIISSPFLVYKVKTDLLTEAKEDFDVLSFADKKAILLEALDKNMLYVNLSDIDDIDMKVTDSEKEFTKFFYGI